MSNINSNKVCMISLGCAKYLVDSEILIGGLKQENYEIVQKSEDADILIVNTCGFLDTAREESVDVILTAGELRKANQVEKLVVMGCFSDRYGSELKEELAGANKMKSALAEIINPAVKESITKLVEEFVRNKK